MGIVVVLTKSFICFLTKNKYLAVNPPSTSAENFGVSRELAEGRGRAQHLCAGSLHLYPLLRYLYCPFCLPLGFPYVTEGRGGVQHLCAGGPHLYPLFRYCCYQLCRYSGTSPAIAVCASLSPPPVPCSRARHHPWCVAFFVSFVVRDRLLLVLAVVLPVLGCAVGA
jgi:hypothetical protein